MSDSKPVIVVVDDEKNVQNAVKRALRTLDITIDTADNAFDAIAVIKKQPAPPAAILADHRMPGMSGLQLLRKVKEISPATVRILFTAYAEMDIVIRAINEGEVYRFIKKPWDAQELIDVVQHAIEQHELQAKAEEKGDVVRRERSERSTLEADDPGITRLPPQDEEGAFIIEPPGSSQDSAW
jgi:DNA-binding NtrC family response regulator